VCPVFVYTFSLKSREVCSSETWNPPAQSVPYSRNSLIKRYREPTWSVKMRIYWFIRRLERDTDKYELDYFHG